jgi:membrane protein YqaA with SNARE-associated domain
MNDENIAGKIPGWHLHRRLYNWVLHWADSAYSGRALFLLSFAESSFFPVPPDVLLAPLTLGNRKKWWRFALNCSLASLLGGVLGYAIGYWLWWDQAQSFSGLAQFFFEHVPGFTEEKFHLIQSKYEQYSFWVVFAAGFTPIPYKIITISAGAFDINFTMFVIASAIGRGARFFLVAGLFGAYGPSIKPFVDKYFNWLCLLFLLLLIGGFVVLKYIH